MTTTQTTQNSTSGPAETRTTETSPAGRPPLRRPADDRMLAGVASGLSRYFGLDVTLVRIAFFVLAVVSGAGLPLYLAGWLLIPEEGSERSLASELMDSISARLR